MSVAATATPSADCAFWDEALFYIFEVYNINGWIGSDGSGLQSSTNGDGLENQEDGYSDLTGWQWSIDTTCGLSTAYFNLPFLNKAGCVERAIASAGGPTRLSCMEKALTGYGFLTLLKNGGATQSYPVLISTLSKSLQPAMSAPKSSSSTPDGTALSKSPSTSKMAKRWGANHLCGQPRFDWDTIVSKSWTWAVADTIDKPFGKQGLNLTIAQHLATSDPSLKNFSQAFAEQSAGDAYLFMPEGAYKPSTWNPNSAWGS
ncbi:MAG: hypothetical protein M1827_000433 [Pycnora praestabilis]|nr:MAG: hypothetical protein M1827_000433 [Pycnora praestabilis]